MAPARSDCCRKASSRVHLGHVAKNYVEHIGRNLLLGICQLVERLVNFLRDDVILHRHWNLYEHVVFGFSFDIESELLHAQIDASGNLVQPGQLEVDAGRGHAKKLAHALHHDGFGGPDLEKALQDGADREESHEHVEDEKRTLGNVHHQFSCW